MWIAVRWFYRLFVKELERFVPTFFRALTRAESTVTRRVESCSVRQRPGPAREMAA